MHFCNFICQNATENAGGYHSTQLGTDRRTSVSGEFCSNFRKVKCVQNEIKPGYCYSLKAFCNSGGCHVLLRRVGRWHLAARLRFSGLLVAHACTRTNNVGAAYRPTGRLPDHLVNTCICLFVGLNLTQRFGRSRTSRNSVHGRGESFTPPQFPVRPWNPLFFLDMVNQRLFALGV